MIDSTKKTLIHKKYIEAKELTLTESKYNLMKFKSTFNNTIELGSNSNSYILTYTVYKDV